jgi:hypothetical protein
MSRTPSLQGWRAGLRGAAAGLLLGVLASAAIAQQPTAADRPTTSHKPAEAPKLKVAPAKEQPIAHAGSVVVDRNAIGLAIRRPDTGQRPIGSNLGRAPGLPPPAPPSGAVGLGSGAIGLGNRALPAPRPPAPGPQPLVVSRGTLNGAAFMRPRTAMAPLGGPAKPATINGTSFRPKP